jgi:hypothetical protein
MMPKRSSAASGADGDFVAAKDHCSRRLPCSEPPPDRFRRQASMDRNRRVVGLQASDRRENRNVAAGFDGHLNTLQRVNQPACLFCDLPKERFFSKQKRRWHSLMRIPSPKDTRL